jgi:hypothetical protein
MYNPQLNQEIVRQRPMDMLREAERERLAHLAKGGTSGPSALDRVRHLASGLTENVRAQMRRRAVREPIADASA